MVTVFLCNAHSGGRSACESPPGSVAGVTGGRTEARAPTVGMLNFNVILLSAQLLAQHPVGLVQLHKLAVQRRVGRVTVWVQLCDSSATFSNAVY